MSALSDPSALDRDEVIHARDATAGRLHRTPVFTSQALGPGVYLKAELFQNTGSFKPRGVLNKLATLSAEDKRRGVRERRRRWLPLVQESSAGSALSRALRGMSLERGPADLPRGMLREHSWDL